MDIDDAYAPYERGLAALLGRIARDTPAYAELLIAQQRLTENIRQARREGDTEQRRADRAGIIAGLNALARAELGTDFNSLCSVIATRGLHHLRPPVGDFVGRADEIELLVRALLAAAGTGAAAAISGVRGMGGIGKTELAYCVAQRLQISFPDAQLLIELHGAGATPLSPEQALQTVIRVFEPTAKLPDDLAQLTGLYTDVLTGKRALILADDARDAAQVRPLLPPPGCALIITTRNRFALPAMRALDLGTLPPDEAAQLLLAGCARIGEHAAVLAKLCGYLPLALRVSAAVLEANDDRSVPRYLAQLATERLKHLSDPDDPAASVEASLQLSYAALPPDARAALCQLSVFPTSFDAAAALAVIAVEGTATDALELLRRRSLLEWDAKLERYSLHDLARAFATARLADADAARLRHAGFYARLARTLAEWYRQGGTSLSTALMMFDRERIHLDTGWKWLITQATSLEGDALFRDYSYLTADIGSLRYHPLTELIPKLEIALDVARRAGDKGTEGAWLTNLGSAYVELGDAHKAIGYYEQRLGIAREMGNRRGEGAALNNLGIAYAALGDAHKAIDYYEQRLVIAREIGDRRGEGNTLGNLGIAYKNLGDAHKAIGYYEQHLVITREMGDRRGEGNALGNLGSAYADLGDARQAIAYYEQRLVIAREIGDRSGEAIASWNLGLALEKQGDLTRAVALMQVYVDYLRELGRPDAEKRAAFLEGVRGRGAGGGE